MGKRNKVLRESIVSKKKQKKTTNKQINYFGEIKK